ncbi:MAG: caspase domain-containing protein, partial [Halocynthiibacter sp.]
MRFVLLIIALLLPSAALSAERIALVIGMAQYRNIVTLKNTVNDARAIAGALDSVGFKVTEAIDKPLDELKAMMADFAFRAETAELALIYFAGHGVEVEGENFLIPIDADVKTNADIQRQSVSLRDFLQTVDRARKMRIV